jgi:hypothetical protein
VTKLNANVCAQIERAAELLREVATRSNRRVGRGAPVDKGDVDELIDVAASLEAIVKREKRFSTSSSRK